MQSPFGIGLREAHVLPLLTEKPDVGWLEVHSENYFSPTRWPMLEKIAEHYPLSFHGIGLSLGSVDALNIGYLDQLKRLVDHFQPNAISDHLSWCSFQGEYFNDLLPMIYNQSSLDLCCRKIDHVQRVLNRPLRIENPSTYVEAKHSTLNEATFWQALADKTGCELLLDFNNLFVNSRNHGFNAMSYLNQISAKSITEIHLAGGICRDTPNGEVWIDSHSTPVNDVVWQWYQDWVTQHGLRETLIEWDQDLPDLTVLLNEMHIAQEKSHVRLF
jgi:hypothetical protein